VAGEKKKKSGLIGKLKKLTRKSVPTEEKEFGSGSDISSVSMASSSVSAFQRVQQKRAASQDRSKSKERGAPAPAPAPEPEKRKPPQAPNDPFEKYFVKSEAASGRPAQSSSSSSTLPRYSRPF
jgi:flagellar capping protein FliD